MTTFIDHLYMMPMDKLIRSIVKEEHDIALRQRDLDTMNEVFRRRMERGEKLSSAKVTAETETERKP